MLHELKLLRSLHLDRAFAEGFEGLHLKGTTRMDVRTAAEAPYYTAWSVVVLRTTTDAYWCTLRLDMDRRDAQWLFEHARAHGARLSKTQDVLRQCLLLTHEVLFEQVNTHEEAAMADLQDEPPAPPALRLFLPFDPVVMRTRSVPGDLSSARIARFSFGLRLPGGMRLRVSSTLRPGRFTHKDVDDLRRFDLLARPLMTSDAQILLREGIMLDVDYIEKIRAIVENRSLSDVIHVFRPPSGMAVFLDRL